MVISFLGILVGWISALPFLFLASSFHRRQVPTTIVAADNSDRKEEEKAEEESPNESAKKTLIGVLASLTETNSELQKRLVKELDRKLKMVTKHEALKKQIAEKQQDPIPIPTGSIKNSPTTTNNPALAKLLEEISISKELILSIADSKAKETLQIWFRTIKRLEVKNYLVIALDDETFRVCKANDVPVFRNWLTTTTRYLVLKYKVLSQILRMGYSVLYSDTDVAFLRSPFEHLYRDCDVEASSDGHTRETAYGLTKAEGQEGGGDPNSNLCCYSWHVWGYNPGFFYIRPTLTAIEFVEGVMDRFSRFTDEESEQLVFNDELHPPPYPAYDGRNASKRTMDWYLFMNSKTLFETVRTRDPKLNVLIPVMVHCNFHPDKPRRMEAAIDFYLNGNGKALDPFPDETKTN